MTEAIPPPTFGERVRTKGLFPAIGEGLLGPSYRTRLAGLAGAAVVAGPPALEVISKGKPLVEALPAFALAFFFAYLGHVARDDKVTSEQAGAKQKPPPKAEDEGASE